MVVFHLPQDIFSLGELLICWVCEHVSLWFDHEFGLICETEAFHRLIELLFLEELDSLDFPLLKRRLSTAKRTWLWVQVFAHFVWQRILIKHSRCHDICNLENVPQSLNRHTRLWILIINYESLLRPRNSNVKLLQFNTQGSILAIHIIKFLLATHDHNLLFSTFVFLVSFKSLVIFNILVCLPDHKVFKSLDNLLDSSTVS